MLRNFEGMTILLDMHSSEIRTRGTKKRIAVSCKFLDSRGQSCERCPRQGKEVWEQVPGNKVTGKAQPAPENEKERGWPAISGVTLPDDL